MKQLTLKKEPPNQIFSCSVYSVYIDNKKVGEHLRMDEALQFIEMVESGEVNV